MCLLFAYLNSFNVFYFFRETQTLKNIDPKTADKRSVKFIAII